MSLFVDGGGWTGFWWYESGDISGVGDFLGSDLKDCSPDDNYCFAKMPIDNPDALYVYTTEKDGSETAWATWEFDSTDTSTAAEAAFTSRTTASIGGTTECWNPVRYTSNYDPDASGCNKEFWYADNNGVVTVNLDDDTAWARSAFLGGHSEGRDESINAVDCLEQDGAAGVQRHCEMYYR